MANLGEYLGAGAGVTKLLLHLNGNSTDTSGNSNSGTDTNITYSQANGKFGQGAGFNGSSSKIINTTQIGNVNDEKTISLWAYNNEVMSGANKYTIIFELAFGTQRAGYQFLFERENNVNRVRAVRDRGCVGGEDIFLDIGSNQKWFHLVLTLIGTTMSFYVDKKLIGSVTINTGNGSCNNQLGYYIGCGRASSIFSNVKVEEVIVENRGWTQSYIDKYYTNAKGFYATL